MEKTKRYSLIENNELLSQVEHNQEKDNVLRERNATRISICEFHRKRSGAINDFYRVEIF